MVDISALFGSAYPFADMLKARAQIPGQVAKAQTVTSVKSSITDSVRLTEDGKKGLSALADTVDKFAQGNQKLLRDVVGISNLQQFGAKEQAGRSDSPYAKLLSAFYTSKTGGVIDLVS